MVSLRFTLSALALLLSFSSAVYGYEFSAVKPEYLLDNYQLQNQPQITNGSDDILSYVFLQRFPLRLTPFFHTEIVVCPRSEFTVDDQNVLDNQAASISPSCTSSKEARLRSNTDELKYFVEIDESWWSKRDNVRNCTELGYGSAPCTEKCCSVPHGQDQVQYPLNARRAMITNADTSKKSLFLYGKGSFSGDYAYDAMCSNTGNKCWSNWSGTDYRLLKNNCNTFTSTVLSCVYGLSEKKPHLGVSDLVTVKCDCDQSTSTNVAVQ